jgi:hypothetical protein
MRNSQIKKKDHWDTKPATHRPGIRAVLFVLLVLLVPFVLSEAIPRLGFRCHYGFSAAQSFSSK